LAYSMVNFAYAIGDKATGECVLVDPAYAPGELVALAAADGMRVTGVLGTHYHFDHVGGSFRDLAVPGLAELLNEIDVPVHLNAHEVPWVTRTTGVAADSLVGHESGDLVRVGDVTIELVHTPGHTPGSQCFLVDGRLVSGDTLFLEGCGRTDLPGSDPEEMWRTLQQRLLRVSADTLVFPGHLYSAERFAPMGTVRELNYALAPVTAEQWVAMFAR